MKLSATLTIGWAFPPSRATTAIEVVNHPELFPRSGEKRLVLHHCEGLFRRKTGGYGNWNSFLNWLNDSVFPNDLEIECRFDAFSYAFLSVAKNADFQIPINSDSPIATPQFEDDFEKFFDDIDDLTRLEGLGIRPNSNELLERYILARESLIRPSARDERRIIANMFVNGSSSGSDLERELGIYEGLPERILLSLERAGCVRKDPDRVGHFLIDHFAMGICYFLVRETLGFSLKKIIERYV